MNRAEWVKAQRDGTPTDAVRPQSEKIDTFEGGRITIFFFKPRRRPDRLRDSHAGPGTARPVKDHSTMSRRFWRDQPEARTPPSWPSSRTTSTPSPTTPTPSNAVQPTPTFPR